MTRAKTDWPDQTNAGEGFTFETLRQQEADLGLEASFAKLPARISLGNRSYYLVRGEEGYQLLSTVCPHQGGEVVNVGPYFECPYHGWRFEHGTGKCTTALNQQLSSIPVTVRGGHLFAEVPLPSTSSAPAAQKIKLPDRLTIQLHAHACLEISYQGASLLTDPWLYGPAFFGSWTQYPPPVVEVSALRPRAILISHEHSDHFHEPTLRELDRATPIYVPDFPNRRLGERLAALGFANVCQMAFGKTYELERNIKLTCFEPESLWNDAIVLIEIDGFRLLNINDAGLNRRIASEVAPVNTVASQFSSGASGYPLTWSHLTETEKIQLLERACQGKLQMLREAMELYGGEYLIPFASHFALWHPSHRAYARMMRTNTVDDVVRAFDGTDVRVIDLLPGETWGVSSGDITRVWRERKQLYNRSNMLRYLERRFDARVFEKDHCVSEELTRAELEAYFLGLNDVPEIVFCEDLTVTVRTTSDALTHSESDLNLSFEVAAGQLRILPSPPAAPNLLIEIPRRILKRIVTENLSWDEAHIGYWCRFTRSPDVYHAGFWRLLQAPYFNRPVTPPPVDRQPITAASVIADLIETYGQRAERSLRRYGLYCAGCHHSANESIALGAKRHGIEERQIGRLVRELNQILCPSEMG